MKNFIEIYIKYRSFVGIISLIAVLYLAQPNALSVTIGFFLIISGMFFRGWSSGYLNKDTELAQHGPYSLTRNPLYFGNFVLGLGIAAASHSFWGYIIFFVFYFSFFPFLMAIEHKRLKEKFGIEYETWAARSHSFFPKIKKINKANFNISYYMKNKEYRVLYFSLFVIAVLILKVLKIIKTV